MISCLRRVGVEVVERHVSVWEGRQRNWAAGVATSIKIAFSELRLLRRPRDFDALIVGYPGHFDFPLARWAARRRPVVFNPLVSLADTLVEDRGRFRRGSLAARTVELVDRRAFRSADLVVADTQAHASFFVEAFGLRPERVAVCLVGAEEAVFRPPWSPSGRFLFVGKLIPLHGLDTILAAARLAPELEITVAGSGQLDHLLRDRPPNVEWIPWIAYEQLGDSYRHALCALGIFGTSAKATRVIPNKVFQALACGAPVLTANTPAAQELLVDGESALLVRAGDPEALAEAMRRAARDRNLLGRLAAGGLRAYRQHASEEVLGLRWRGILEGIL